MKEIHDFLSSRLSERKLNHSFRSLPTENRGIDFCSNDYLGFARSEILRYKTDKQLQYFPNYPLGSTGSRLISGNSPVTESLEYEIAAFHCAEAGLIFNSGYDANLGLFSALAQRGDTVIADELAHASIIDGIRLSNANRYSFKHNDTESLKEKLKAAKGKIFIAVESVYSMDGDEAPLKAITDLAEEFNAAVIVDEAHATGIFGTQGRGLVCEQQLEDKVFARVITFGKALGAHGAVVIGSKQLRDYLVNFARPFIYSTAAPLHSHLVVHYAYELLKESNYQQEMHRKINLFRENAAALAGNLIYSRSPIQSLLIPGNEKARRTAAGLVEAGFNIRAILHPTVAEGKERLRICLHTFNRDEEIRLLCSTLTTIL